MHAGRHYLTIVRDAISAPTGVVLLDSLYPGIIEVWTAEDFKAAASAKRKRKVASGEVEVPAFKLLQVFEGKLDDMDSRARAHAEAGGGFDLDHTRGYWLGGKWVSTARTTRTFPSTAPMLLSVPDLAAAKPSHDVGDVMHQSQDSDDCPSAMNSADSPPSKRFKMAKKEAMRLSVPDLAAAKPSQDVGNVSHQSHLSDDCPSAINSADSQA